MIANGSTELLYNNNGTFDIISHPDPEIKTKLSANSSLFDLIYKTISRLKYHTIPAASLYINDLKLFQSIIETYPESVNYADSCNHTPLMLSAYDDNLELVKLLIDSKADPYIRDINGHNMFDIAHSNYIQKDGHGTVFQYLIDRLGQDTFNRYVFGVRYCKAVCCIDDNGSQRLSLIRQIEIYQKYKSSLLTKKILNLQHNQFDIRASINLINSSSIVFKINNQICTNSYHLSFYGNTAKICYINELPKNIKVDIKVLAGSANINGTTVNDYHSFDINACKTDYISIAIDIAVQNDLEIILENFMDADPIYIPDFLYLYGIPLKDFKINDNDEQ